MDNGLLSQLKNTKNVKYLISQYFIYNYGYILLYVILSKVFLAMGSLNTVFIKSTLSQWNCVLQVDLT